MQQMAYQIKGQVHLEEEQSVQNFFAESHEKNWSPGHGTALQH